MNERELKLFKILANEMAFEGATKHFQCPEPDIDIGIFQRLNEIGYPQKYSGEFENYVDVEINYSADKSEYQNCYLALRLIRNNIIHANKVILPDTTERIENLLDWSIQFIDAVNATESQFADMVNQIKSKMGISNF